MMEIDAPHLHPAAVQQEPAVGVVFDVPDSESGERHVGRAVPIEHFGTELNDKPLTPGDTPHVGSTWFETWLGRA